MTPNPDSHSHLSRSLGFAAAAYLIWGLSPIYFKVIGAILPLEILAHRIIWSVVIFILLLGWQRRWAEVLAAFGNPRTFFILLLTTFLISGNWYSFIWATTHKLVLQSSLGYFINPLLNALLGMLVLKERLRRGQMLAVILATIGVVCFACFHREVPTIALLLAFTGALYILIRKMAPVGPLIGLCVETAILLPVALGLAAYRAPGTLFSSTSVPFSIYVLLPVTGLVTAVPLLFFNAAARVLRLTTMGFIQYLTPTTHFLLAVFVFREGFSWQSLLSFTFIWVGVGLYCIDSLRVYRLSIQTHEPPKEEPVLTDM
jgi:chloramphenicol-sensitive protein RarD